MLRRVFFSSPHLDRNTITMSNDLSSLLLASLQPASRKQAEQSLTSLSAQPGFIGALLQLVLGQGTTDRSVRLAASVYLKNVTKLRWDEVRILNAHAW